MPNPHRDIVAFYSSNWDGKVDVKNCEITDDGTQGFCILVNGTYAIHKDSGLRYSWIEHGEGLVKLSPADLHVKLN